MNRAQAASRSVRTAAAAAGVVGAFALAGCSTAADAQGAGTADGGTPGAPAYTDGTYTAEGSYATPDSVEQIMVTVTLQGDVITAVEVAGDPSRPESARYQSRFIDGIAQVAVGRDIDELQVDRVAGSSLTSGGFTQAIESIKTEAAR